jgi:hypothetical protein
MRLKLLSTICACSGQHQYRYDALCPRGIQASTIVYPFRGLVVSPVPQLLHVRADTVAVQQAHVFPLGYKHAPCHKILNARNVGDGAGAGPVDCRPTRGFRDRVVELIRQLAELCRLRLQLHLQHV